MMAVKAIKKSTTTTTTAIDPVIIAADIVSDSVLKEKPLETVTDS